LFYFIHFLKILEALCDLHVYRLRALREVQNVPDVIDLAADNNLLELNESISSDLLKVLIDCSDKKEEVLNSISNSSINPIQQQIEAIRNDANQALSRCPAWLFKAVRELSSSKPTEIVKRIMNEKMRGSDKKIVSNHLPIRFQTFDDHGGKSARLYRKFVRLFLDLCSSTADKTTLFGVLSRRRIDLVVLNLLKHTLSLFFKLMRRVNKHHIDNLQASDNMIIQENCSQIWEICRKYEKEILSDSELKSIATDVLDKAYRLQTRKLNDSTTYSFAQLKELCKDLNTSKSNASKRKENKE